MSYTPTNWKSGDKVTSNKLNKIEQGIQDNNNEINSIKEELEDITDVSGNLNTTGTGRFYVGSTGIIGESSENYIGMKDVILCLPNTKYTVRFFDTDHQSALMYVAYFTSDKVFIKRDSYNGKDGNLYLTVTTPENAGYIYFDMYHSEGITESAKIFVVLGETIPTEYTSIVTAIDNVARENINILTTMTNKQLSELSISVKSVVEENNLNITGSGRFYVSSTGTIQSSSEYYIGMQDVIECSPNTVYSIKYFDTGNESGILYTAYYTSNKTFIRRDSVNSNLSLTITTPDNAYYMYTDMYHSYGINAAAKIMIIKGNDIPENYSDGFSAVDNTARKQINSLINTISGKTFPSYYDNNVETVIANTKNNINMAGINGDSFIFVTDAHWGLNAKHSPEIIKYLLTNIPIRNVIFGGDALDSGTKEAEMAKAYDFMSAYNFVDDGLKYVLGNHDGNHNQHGSDDSYWFSSEELYGIFYSPSKMEMKELHTTTGKVRLPTAYGYFDVPSVNVRYIIVGSPFGVIDDTEFAWIENQLTNNPSLHFVLFAHFLYDSSSGYTNSANKLFELCDEYNNVSAIVYGHTHLDYVDYTANGIPIISTDTDAYSRLDTMNPNTATIGTITEHAFDVYTIVFNQKIMTERIGRGKNRTIYNGNNTINVNGNITLTSTLTSPTWSTYDNNIATVSNGVVTGIASGKTVVVASTETEEEYFAIKII